MASSSTQLAASSSVPPPSPPSSSFRLIHDVFLSFRGEDTRNSFTSHLYATLIQKGIHAYLDDSELERGKAIEPSLWTAIEESRFSIVVFSKGYASSTWCLDELVKIVECMNDREQIVFPIFYDVDPSDVADQKGDYYGRAFMKHQQDFLDKPEKVQRWRDAVTQVANLSGWDTRNRNESKIIGEIIDKILDRLSPTFSSINKYLVGMHSRVKAMHNLLIEGENEVRTIGIHGIGGIGKTTVARVVYDRICHRFEGSCFIANVREVFDKYGPSHLQEQLLSEILQQRNAKIWDAGRGISEIKRRLRHRKVLIVMDDVNELKQLEMLAIKNGSFGLGSRIIITTRDKQLLVAHGVDKTYEVGQLNYVDALMLFSQKAFKKDKPAEGYCELTNCVVGYCQGLPLALEVLGSFLCGRRLDRWESAIRRLEKVPNKEILNVLRISLDGLSELDKKIFLDIACFFNGKEKDEVTKILDYFGFEAKIGIEVLEEKSLISIMSGLLWMHDLIQILGQEIVRQESPEEPGGRSRLWSYEDIFHVLRKNTGGEAVEAIVVNLPVVIAEQKIHLHVEAFSKMSRLRLLIIPNLHLQEGALYPFDKLRFLKLRYCSSKSLPSSFQLEDLSELDMSYSSVEQLWQGQKTLHQLKVINLSHCQKLIKTPDLTGTSDLERLIFEGCTSLFYIHPSFGGLRKLVYVNFVGCSKLKKFPEIHENMEYLQELLLDGAGIQELPASIQHLTGLIVLSLKDCKNLESLPSSIGLKFVKRLEFSGCPKLVKFPDIIGNMEFLCNLQLDESGIEELPPSIEHMPCLVELSLRNCKKLRSLPSSIDGLKSLGRLDVSGCSELRKFPDIVGNMECLLKLCLDGTGIGELQHSLFQRLPGLVELSLRNCKKIRSLPSSINRLKSLITLDVGCSKLENLPDSLGEVESLKILDVSQTAVTQPPDSIFHLKNLQYLYFHGCGGEFSRKIGNPTTLVLPSLSGLHSLEELDLSNCNLGEGDIPNDLGCLASLLTLDLSNNNFVSLPTSISQPSRLETLKLKNCKMLQSLPDLPSKLSHISMSSCSSLEKVTPIKSNESYISVYGENCFKLCDHDSDDDSTAFTILKMFLQDAISSETGRIDIVIPGSEIPKWFTYKNKEDSDSVRIPSLDSLNDYNNGVWIGMTACAVVSPTSKQNEDECSNWISCSCEDIENDFLGHDCCEVEFGGIGSDHLWLFYLSRERVEYLAERPHKLVFDPHEEGILKVIKCGFRPVYCEDIEELGGIVDQWESCSSSSMDFTECI